MNTQIDISGNPELVLERHFSGLYSTPGRSSIRGGQTAANKAIADLDISGYAANRSEVYPANRRGASGLSPYIRHNLLTLKSVWKAVERAPYQDREKFRDELLWQEYARHLYARVGVELFKNLRYQQVWDSPGDGWSRELACIDFVVDELEQEGWLVNQTRMWLASHWTVRNGRGWLLGQERMYRELLDGSRAANLLGWQWTVGSGSGKPYGFARWQVEKRAPGLCSSCPLRTNCPIEDFPAEQSLTPESALASLDLDLDLESTTGPLVLKKEANPELVLLTIDSMGDADPALVANPNLPVAFVFNKDKLAHLQLSAKRLIFYIETLQDLASRREVQAHLGSPYDFARDRAVAVTYAPVPSFNKFENLAEVHPYPWLRLPHSHSLRSFSAWRKKLR